MTLRADSDSDLIKDEKVHNCRAKAKLFKFMPTSVDSSLTTLSRNQLNEPVCKAM